MDDATQKLVDELIRLYEPERAEDAGLPEELNAENLDAWAPFVLERTARTRQLLGRARIALEAAQRPPVPEPDNHHNADVCPFCTRNREEREAAIRAEALAQRPPVSPEVREAVRAATADALAGWLSTDRTRESDNLVLVITDALLARFSVPSQPVYDEEAIACVLWDAAEVTEDTGRDRHLWENVSKDVADWWRAVAAALVAALRGGELTREEKNRG